ncbi:uncharacterized protein C8orf34 homolog [Gadus chalcogrammus]|uniref:uncharacterized protein C8orf34 homolog n=1 Tax=Gadus chalcogrammus TaxID=1042646 RepID=UPI0024C48C6E|nr:uncharacterized protein C8orf34 homolog [Gadus chalcogrammus]
MASPQQSRIQSYLESNKIGPLFEELMTKLITETPDHPIPFLIDHLQTKQGSPGRLQRTLSGSAALWADGSAAESKSTRRECRNFEKPWQVHSKKPKKSKSDLAMSSISPPSPESKSLPRANEYPWWEWRESRDFDELNHILQESKKLGKALESLSRSIAISDELDQNLGCFDSSLRPRVVGEWVGRQEVDSDPLAAEMLQPPVPRAKSETWGSRDSSPAGSPASTHTGPMNGSSHVEGPQEDLDDLRMEGVTGLVPSGSKFSQGRSSYQSEPQAKVTLNICSRCARLQGDSLSDTRSVEGHASHVPEQAVPDISALLPGVDTVAGRLKEFEVASQRQPVWESDLKPVRGGSAAGQPLLGDSLFSKELETMGKHLAEVEKDLAKLAEAGKMTSRGLNNPASSGLLSPLLQHRTLPNTLPLQSLLSRPQSPAGGLSSKPSSGGLPMLSPKHSSLTGGRTVSNPGSRTQTPRTPSRPLTPNSLMSRSGGHKEVTFRRSRSRPVTPTCQPMRPRPLLTPPGLSTTDSLGASLRAYLSEDEFYQQLQGIRQPWHLPSDPEGDMLEPPEQDRSGVRDGKKRSVFSGL